MNPEVFTIGHSTLTYESFVRLLRLNGITAVADVRSSPQSRTVPHFCQEPLQENLQRDGVQYVFLGDQLGGRPRRADFYCDGVADYEKMAADGAFAEGIGRVVRGTEKFRIALMCSERNPLDCHRCLLVGRALKNRGVRVAHILQSGDLASQDSIEDELIRTCGHGGDDMFASGPDRLADAYRERSRQVAYRKPKAA